jgi:hypothetical protein
MNIKTIALLLFSGSALLASCQKRADPAIEALFRSNFSYAQNEKLSEYMSTIDPSAPMRGQTEVIVKKLFSTYDLSYDLESIEVISEDSTQAVVRVSQTTKKVKGPDFRDNRIVTTNKLRKSGDQWKIFDSKVEKIEYLK